MAVVSSLEAKARAEFSPLTFTVTRHSLSLLVMSTTDESKPVKTTDDGWIEAPPSAVSPSTPSKAPSTAADTPGSPPAAAASPAAADRAVNSLASRLGGLAAEPEAGASKEKAAPVEGDAPEAGTHAASSSLPVLLQS